MSKTFEQILLNAWAQHSPAPASMHDIAFETGRIYERERIKTLVANTYPHDIFPEPDLEEARKALATIGITLDAVAASVLRRVVPNLIKEDPDK